MALSFLFWITGVLWLTITLCSLYSLLVLRRLPPLHAHPSAALPRVSVIVPARDEQARVEATVRRLLAQRGVAV